MSPCFDGWETREKKLPVCEWWQDLIANFGSCNALLPGVRRLLTPVIAMQLFEGRELH